MKKALFSATVLAAALISTAAIASIETSGYTLTTTPKGIRISETDIIVNNFTSQEIFLTVPGRLMVGIYPNETMHVLKNDRYNTWINLYDTTSYNFYSGNLCRYAVVSVYSPTASGSVTDTSYCLA